MKTIGLKNFRRYKDLQTLDLGPITFFVGENNAGKSTIVKAILSLNEYTNTNNNYFRYFDKVDFEMNEGNYPSPYAKFFFNSNYFAHIGTFNRALNNRADDNTIVFEWKYDQINVELHIKRDEKNPNAVSGQIVWAKTFIERLGIELTYDFENDTILVKFKEKIFYKEILDENGNEIRISNESAELIIPMHMIEAPQPNPDLYEIDDYNYESSDVIDQKTLGINNSMYKWIEKDNSISWFYSTFVNILLYIVKSDMDQKGKTYKYDEFFEYLGYDDFDVPQDTKDFLIKWYKPILKTISSAGIDFNGYVEYIYAHAVSQNIIYNKKDSNDYLAKTICELADLALPNDSDIHDFITKWMKEFKIGKDYSLELIGGEAYIVKIKNMDDTEVNLCDKGMGAIQLIVLLFRLGILMITGHMTSNVWYKNSESTTIIIEEPEQNLHPSFQSKLANLFYEVHTKYGFRFIVETHSEYLIRYTQVLVSEHFNTDELIKKNPFKVYYFPHDGNPYEMGYDKSGFFLDKFGDGFMNEADKWHMQILMNANKQK